MCGCWGRKGCNSFEHPYPSSLNKEPNFLFLMPSFVIGAIISICNWGNWGFERLQNISKFTLLINYRTGIKTELYLNLYHMLFVMHSKVFLKRKSNTIRYVLHKDNLQHFKKIGLKEMIVKSRTEVKFFLNNSIKSYKISLLGFYLSDSGHLYVVHLYSYIYIYIYV